MDADEWNFDGIVGPTHNYMGLARGNIASMQNLGGQSNPKLAALQGLSKMLQLHRLGFKQAVLPPHERPYLPGLRALGFSGSDEAVLAAAYRKDPALLAVYCSASPMWTANAATVSPSADTTDGRVHFCIANLMEKRHRAIEASTTLQIFRAIFTDSNHFEVHPALEPIAQWGDEGAANHTRLCRDYGDRGVPIFVYGRSGTAPFAHGPQKYPARQSLEASQEVAKRLALPLTEHHFLKQNPSVIDAGVFHNDVISVGNRGVFFYHERAFWQADGVMQKLCADPRIDFYPIVVAEKEVPVAEAVRTYLFNSQLLGEAGAMLLVAPEECAESSAVSAYLEALLQSGGPIQKVRFFNLRESMKNGGGPACLRLRVVLTEAEAAAMNPGIRFTEELYQTLVGWVERHYRDSLLPGDLADPALLEESRRALDELTRILHLRSLYPFQGVSS